MRSTTSSLGSRSVRRLVGRPARARFKEEPGDGELTMFMIRTRRVPGAGRRAPGSGRARAAQSARPLRHGREENRTPRSLAHLRVADDRRGVRTPTPTGAGICSPGNEEEAPGLLDAYLDRSSTGATPLAPLFEPKARGLSHSARAATGLACCTIPGAARARSRRPRPRTRRSPRRRGSGPGRRRTRREPRVRSQPGPPAGPPRSPASPSRSQPHGDLCRVDRTPPGGRPGRSTSREPGSSPQAGDAGRDPDLPNVLLIPTPCHSSAAPRRRPCRLSGRGRGRGALGGQPPSERPQQGGEHVERRDLLSMFQGAGWTPGGRPRFPGRSSRARSSNARSRGREPRRGQLRAQRWPPSGSDQRYAWPAFPRDALDPATTAVQVMKQTNRTYACKSPA